MAGSFGISCVALSPFCVCRGNSLVEALVGAWAFQKAGGVCLSQFVQLRQHRGHRRLHSPSLYGHQGGAQRRHYRNPHRAAHRSHSLQGSRRHGHPQSHGRRPSPDRHRHRPHSRQRAVSECLDRKMVFDDISLHSQDPGRVVCDETMTVCWK